MSNWKQKIEAQIVSLKAEEREARAYDDEDYGDLFKETYTMLQALLDVAVAADLDRNHPAPFTTEKLDNALDKLREVCDA